MSLLVTALVLLVILVAENTRRVKVGWIFGYAPHVPRLLDPVRCRDRLGARRRDQRRFHAPDAPPPLTRSHDGCRTPDSAHRRRPCDNRRRWIRARPRLPVSPGSCPLKVVHPRCGQYRLDRAERSPVVSAGAQRHRAAQGRAEPRRPQPRGSRARRGPSVRRPPYRPARAHASARAASACGSRRLVRSCPAATQ